MRIDFRKLEIHNFMSFDDTVLEFPSEPGLNLICGKNNDIQGAKNGSGKTRLIDSLVFALFGQTKDGLKNENIHNKYVPGKDVRVVAYFDIEKHSYKVASGFNNSGRPYCELYETTDGKEDDLSKSSIAETRSYLTDEILHCDLSIFLRTMLLSSDNNYNFFRLRKAEKKEFIEKLFDISVFGDMYSSIHREVLSLDKDIVSRQNKILVFNKNKDNYAKQAESYSTVKVSKLKALEDKKTALQAELDELKNKDIKSNSEEVGKYELACNLLSDKILAHSTALNAARSKVSEISVQISALEASKSQKQKILDKHQSILGKLCDKCVTAFKDHYNIATYADEIATADKEIACLLESKSKQKEAMAAEQTAIDTLNTKLNLANTKIRTLTAAFNEANRQLANLTAQISVTDTSIAHLAAETNPYTALLEMNDADLAKETKELEVVSGKYKYLKFAENIVSQDTIRKFIISDLIGLLNNKIRSYLLKFGAKYYVTFDSDMNYEFKTEGGTYEYDNFSSGERARIMIASCFAFRDFMRIKNNLSSNILVLDEFIDGAIDSLAIESILDILRDFSKTWNQSIYVISHRKEALSSDHFSKVIQVQKTHNISKICYLES